MGKRGKRDGEEGEEGEEGWEEGCERGMGKRDGGEQMGKRVKKQNKEGEEIKIEGGILISPLALQ